jgi:CBS domain-containing protein
LKRVLSKDGEWSIEQDEESSAFKPKGVQYRVSSTNLQAIKDFPYDFKWTRQPNKTLVIAKVMTTLVNPIAEGKGEVHFEVTSRRENFKRTFSSVVDLLRFCDNVEEQIVSKDMVAYDRVLKARFDCTPPIVLEREDDNITLLIDKAIEFADQLYVLCEGWMFDSEEILVKNVMHSITCVDGSLLISEVAKLMNDKVIGSVLVRDSEGRIAGVFTERDAIRRVIAKGVDPATTPVKSIMSTPLVTVKSDMSIDEAAKLMAEKKIRRLPVVEGGKIVGIVTDRDVIRTVPTLSRR